MDKTSLSQLPPPPQGQTGVTLESLQNLPPPPQGQRGMTLDQVQNQGQLGTLPKPNLLNGGLGQVPGDLGKVASQFPGQELGKAIGTSFQALGQAGGQALQGNFSGAGQTLSQAGNENSNNAGKIIGDTVNAVATPASLLMGGGAGKTALGRIGNAALKYGGVGAVQQAGQAASQGQSAGNVVKAGVTGGLVGGAGGAIGQGISEGVTAYKASQNSLSKLADETSGVADKKARISSLEQTGAVDKKGNPIGGTKQTLMGGIQTEPTGRDLARAKDVSGIVKPGAGPVKNLTSLNKEISRISEKEVTPILEKAGSVTPISEKTPGWNTTVQRLADIEKPDIIKADATLDKTYDLVRQRMVDQIQKQPATVKGLWDARIEFDRVVKDQFGDVAFDSEKNTAIKRAVMDMRREVNNIIGEREPMYKPFMDKLSNLYDARYNIAEQYQNIVNKGGVKAFTTLNPKTAALLKWGIGGVGYEAAKHTVAPSLPGI